MKYDIVAMVTACVGHVWNSVSRRQTFECLENVGSAHTYVVATVFRGHVLVAHHASPDTVHWLFVFIVFVVIVLVVVWVM